MFADLINRLAKEYQSEEHGPYHARPSLAGPERCIRSLVYAALGEPPAPFKGRTILTFDDSSWHEELTIDWMNKSVLKVHSRQMPINVPAPGVNPNGFYCTVCEKEIPPFTLHGHIDGIVQDPIGRECLLEHKAYSRFGCDRLEKELPLDPFAQGTIYSYGLQLAQVGLDGILFVIKNKDTAQYLEFGATFNIAEDVLTVHNRIISQGDAAAQIDVLNHPIEKAFQSSIEKFQEVERFTSERTLPRRPFEYGTNFPCGYCRWGKKCWEGYEQEIEKLTADVALSEEVETAARFYNELGAQISELKTSRDEIGKMLKPLLLERDAKSGRAGEYILLRQFEKRKKYHEDLIPAEAIYYEHQEKFFVKRIKQEDPGKKKKRRTKGDDGETGERT